MIEVDDGINIAKNAKRIDTDFWTALSALAPSVGFNYRLYSTALSNFEMKGKDHLCNRTVDQPLSISYQ